MRKVVGCALCFVGGLVMVDAGIIITDWHWWGIVIPLVVGSMMG